MPIAVHSTYYYKYSKHLNVSSDSAASFVTLRTLVLGPFGCGSMSYC